MSMNNNPLSDIPEGELVKIGKSNSINLWDKEDNPKLRIMSIETEMKEIQQAIFDMKLIPYEPIDPNSSNGPFKRLFRKDSGRQKWGSLEHAQKETDKGLAKIAELEKKL